MRSGASVHASHFLTTMPTQTSLAYSNCACPPRSYLHTLEMCSECERSLSTARKRACISKTLDMPLKVTDKTDRSPSRWHGLSGEHTADVLTRPTEGLSWRLPSLCGPRCPREQPRIHTKCVALTEKPVELAVRAMQYSSRVGENVLDLFGDRRSTLIAAEQTGCRAFLMELDPLYCDSIILRWEEFTGRKAEGLSRDSTGQSVSLVSSRR